MQEQKIEVFKVYDSFASNTDSKYLVLVIYDISCNKKRGQIAKVLQSFGERVQKSAFESILNKNEYSKLIKKISKIIDEEDYLRIYKFTGNTEMIIWGQVKNIKEEDFLII